MNADIQHFWELLWGMTERELRARYKHTMFGFLWLVANPLLQMLVIGFVFRFFIKEPIHNYNYYLFSGLLTWNFFSLTLNKTAPCIVYDRALIKKSPFPKETIPLSILLANAIHYIVGLCIYTIPTLFIGTMTITSPLYISAGVLLLLIFTSGLSLLISALNVKYRDVSFFTQAILTIWFYATPIVYMISVIPKEYMWIWRLNPLTSIIQLIQHGFVNTPPPGAFMLSLNIGLIGFIFFLGIYIFSKQHKFFDDWV